MTSPQGWIDVAFEEITPPDAPIIYGILQPGPDIPGGVPYVRPTEIVGGNIDTANIRRTSTAIAKRYDRASLRSGDTVLSIVGTIGKVAEAPDELDGGNITQSSCRLRHDDSLLSGAYLRAFLRSPGAKAQFDDKRLGTAVPRLNIADIRQFALPLPPLAEQRRILAKLDALTARLFRARAELDRVPVLAANLRKQTLRDAFGPGTQTVPIGELISDIRYGTAKKCDYGGGAVQVLRIPNVQAGRIDLGDLKSADFDAKELAKLSLLEGDILVIRSNGSLDLVGRSAIVDDSAAGMLFAGYLIRMRVDPTKCIPEYLHHFLQSPVARDNITMAAKSTSGVNNVNAQQLQALHVPLPDLATQRSLIQQIEQSFARADRLEAEATRARALLDRLETALLAKAFRGELVPQDPNDEPAQTLLDRIRQQRAAAPKAQRGRKGKVAA